jgi:acetylornithine deacetylase/succinyl-diaminopimelate desuccinylase-like protein
MGKPDSGHRLLLTGHADMVAADGPWSSPPFEMTRTGTTLTGRGVADMKGGLAAYAGALKVLARAGMIADTPVSLVVTGDEEIGSDRGMQPLISQAVVTGQWAIAAEPTDLTSIPAIAGGCGCASASPGAAGTQVFRTLARIRCRWSPGRLPHPERFP